MPLKSKTFSFLLIFCIVPFLAFAVNQGVAPITGKAGAITDLYWISFGGDRNADPIFLMEIDSAGNVIKAPKAVLPCIKYGGCSMGAGATALGSNGALKLNLWVFGGQDILYRAIINKANMALAGVTKTSVVTTDDDGLQVTNRSGNNFLAIEVQGHILKGFPVNASGLPLAGTSWFLSPKAPRANDEGGVSADGRVAVTNRNTPMVRNPPPDELFIQELSTTGRPVNLPKSIASFQDIEASDVTNDLGGGKRFVVYMHDGIGPKADHGLFLQVVNAQGGEVGGPILVNQPISRDQDDQNLAIDPLGRFVVLTLEGKNFGCLNQDILVYQALDSAGHPTGSLKPLVKCGRDLPIDIININIVHD